MVAVWGGSVPASGPVPVSAPTIIPAPTMRPTLRVTPVATPVTAPTPVPVAQPTHRPTQSPTALPVSLPTPLPSTTLEFGAPAPTAEQKQQSAGASSSSGKMDNNTVIIVSVVVVVVVMAMICVGLAMGRRSKLTPFEKWTSQYASGTTGTGPLARRESHFPSDADSRDSLSTRGESNRSNVVSVCLYVCVALASLLSLQYHLTAPSLPLSLSLSFSPSLSQTWEKSTPRSASLRPHLPLFPTCPRGAARPHGSALSRPLAERLDPRA